MRTTLPPRFWNRLFQKLVSRLQSVILKRSENIEYLACAFTGQGVALPASVLCSPRAVEFNIAIMRTLVKLRRLMNSNCGLAEFDKAWLEGKNYLNINL